MYINKQNTVGEVVRANFKAAALFERKGIDFCCGGNITIAEACTAKALNADELLSELEKELQVNDSESKYLDRLSLVDLSNYIINRHHTFVREQIPVIQQKLDKLCAVHGNNHAELFEIKKEFNAAAVNLTQHLLHEEKEYFPYIAYLEQPQGRKHESTVSIAQLREEHQAEGDRFFKIAHLTNQYRVPADACNTYQLTYELLKEFEQDLHRHVHLENNMLFVKAAQIENNK